MNLANEFYGRIHLTFSLHWLILSEDLKNI